jgi:hypothetical protein
MAVTIKEASGVLREQDGQWTIELSGTYEGLADRQLKVLFWGDTINASNEIEEIAQVQQLELAVVAHGLQAEGKLASDREAFLNALQPDSSFAV